MSSRFDGRVFFRNQTSRYSEYFADRTDGTITKSTRGVVQWLTAEIGFPAEEDILRFNAQPHVWTRGDNFYKITHELYGDMNLWWVIPWFNKKPLLSDYSFGDVVYVPLNFSEVYSYFR
jgi:hypothetical protein